MGSEVACSRRKAQEHSKAERMESHKVALVAHIGDRPYKELVVRIEVASDIAVPSGLRPEVAAYIPGAAARILEGAG